MKINLLKQNQINGKKRLKIFDDTNYLYANPTDYTVLQGIELVKKDNDLKANCEYWVSTYFTSSLEYVVSEDGSLCFESPYNENKGIRPVVNFDDIRAFAQLSYLDKNGISEVIYGEYLRNADSKDMQIKLEDLYKKNKLLTTGKTYYSPYSDEQALYEFIYNGEKYVRVPACHMNLNLEQNGCYEFSNGEKYTTLDNVWIKVEPIRWIVDKNENSAVAKEIVNSGICYDDLKASTYTNTKINKYLNEYFKKDIIPSKISTETLCRSYEEPQTKAKTMHVISDEANIKNQYLIKKVRLRNLKRAYLESKNDLENFKRQNEKVLAKKRKEVH